MWRCAIRWLVRDAGSRLRSHLCERLAGGSPSGSDRELSRRSTLAPRGPGRPDGSRARPEPPGLEGGLRLVWLVTLGLGGLQFLALCGYSLYLWRRFDLGVDFAAFSQAWERIAHGHLNPYLTIFPYNYPHYGYPFWQSHLELMMWVLAPLYWLGRTTYVLLVVQDLALAATGVVALRWALEILARHWPHSPRSRTLVGAAAVVAVLGTPWTYWVASYDFHFQPIACFFAVMAGRDLWLGRRRAWIWVAATLLCGDVAATYVVALGLGALLAGRRFRLRGGAVLLAGVVWLAIVAAVGSGKASTLSASYGYLASGTVGSGLSGILAIVWGIVRHPHPALHVLRERSGDLVKYLTGAGTVGLLSPVGLPMAALILGANGLNRSPAFVTAGATFQSMAAVWFLLVGSIAFVCWIARGRRAGAPLALAVAAAVVVQVAWTAADWLPRTSSMRQVPAAVASGLDRAQSRIRPGDEVVASEGVLGRFGGHRWVYPFYDIFSDGQTVPVHSRRVAFIFTDAGGEAPSPGQTAAAVALVSGEPGARVVVRASGVTAVVWDVPPGVTSIRFHP